MSHYICQRCWADTGRPGVGKVGTEPCCWCGRVKVETWLIARIFLNGMFIADILCADVHLADVS